MPKPQAHGPAADARWLVHRYDPTTDRVQFVALDRAARRRAPFLTDANIPVEAPRRTEARAAALAAAGPPVPLRFIFHSAFCCSTLLANALDVRGAASVAKEPVILNDVSGWRRRGAAPQAVGERLGDALALLARPFEAGEAVIIKPSNVVNALAPAMMALAKDSRAVLLYAPLPVFLASIASKGLWGRLWVRELLYKLLRDGIADFGLSEEELFRLSDLQAAALGWLAQHRLFHELARRYGRDRLATLDSETFVARSSEVIEGLAALFRLNIDAGQAQAIAGGPVFTTNSKTGAQFGRAERTAVHEGPAAANADEIGKVMVWAEGTAAHAGLGMQLPGALLA